MISNSRYNRTEYFRLWVLLKDYVMTDTYMCVCVWVYIHIHTHRYINIYISIYIHTQRYMHAHYVRLKNSWTVEIFQLIHCLDVQSSLFSDILKLSHNIPTSSYRVIKMPREHLGRTEKMQTQLKRTTRLSANNVPIFLHHKSLE